MESPAFTAIGMPALRCIVATPRRQSLPSSMSSWTRKALCSISRPRGGRKRIHGAAAQRSRGRDAERRAQTLARSLEEISHEPIEVPLRLPCRYALRQRVAEHLAIPAQAFEKPRWSEDVACARQRLGDLSSMAASGADKTGEPPYLGWIGRAQFAHVR